MDSFKYYSIVLLSLVTIFAKCNAQGTSEPESNKSQWIDLRLGLIGDTQGTNVEFPAYSFGVGGNIKTRKLIIIARIHFNRETGIGRADAHPNAHFWDAGILLGSYFLNTDTRRIFSLSAGVGMISGRGYTSTIVGSGLSIGSIWMYEGMSISTIGIPLEARIMWGKRKPGWGIAVLANINSEVPYFGGALIIPIISF